jgi:hypothetical protein
MAACVFPVSPGQSLVFAAGLLYIAAIVFRRHHLEVFRNFSAHKNEDNQHRPGKKNIEKKQGDPKQPNIQVEHRQHRIGEQKTAHQEKADIPTGNGSAVQQDTLLFPDLHDWTIRKGFSYEYNEKQIEIKKITGSVVLKIRFPAYNEMK